METTRTYRIPIDFLMMHENSIVAWMCVGEYMLWCPGSHCVH